MRTPALENKPVIQGDLEFYLEAFQELQLSTPPGWRIQLSEMLAYCALHSIPEREDFVAAIRKIELIMREHVGAEHDHVHS